MSEQVLFGEKEKCIQMYSTKAFRSSGMVVQQRKSTETHVLKILCGSMYSLERHVGLREMMLFFGGSHRSRSIDRGSELLVYQQEGTDGSMTVPLSEWFKARSRNQAYDEQ